MSLIIISEVELLCEECFSFLNDLTMAFCGGRETLTFSSLYETEAAVSCSDCPAEWTQNPTAPPF